MLINFNYLASLLIFLIGLYGMLCNRNLIKKIISMGIFQSGVMLFFISMAKVENGKIPFLKCLNFNICPEVYSNPLPQILILTAIVVSVSTFATALAIIILIKRNLGTIEEEQIENLDYQC